MKKQRGITLIALIITVILMLILAGVVISLTIGEKGLIQTAKYAV
ncbi:MAG: type II secretion system protein GspG, partial [Clostridia bacterium]|nr:type II secretion system protein GspG [Clostridia bacterium]